MAIPSRLEIQLVDKAGQGKPIENIFFGLKIRVSSNLWVNMNFLKTDFLGKIVMSNEEMLQNAGLSDYLETLNKSKSTNFELFLYEGEFLEDLVQKISKILKSYYSNNRIKEELLRHNIDPLNDKTRGAIKKAFINDLNLYNSLKIQNNSFISMATNSIVDTWIDDREKKYEFIID